MEYVKDRELFSNPYIIQMDRFAESLKHLSETFLYLEDYKGSFTKDEIEEMFRRVSERVCTNCEKRNWCLCENRIQTCQMVCEILCTAEEFGAELNVEIKRKLQKKCDRAPRFLRETLEVFGDAKQKLLWNNRIVQNREGCARSLISFADTISQAARELGAGIYSDERLEKKIVNQLKKVGIRVISSVFYMTKAGKCEVHLTLKAAKGHCVATKEMAKIVSNCVGRSWWKQKEEFEAFHGPILMTTNCLVPPNSSYQDRIYNTGPVGYPGCHYIPGGIGEEKDFSEIIDHAKKCPPPEQLESGTIVGGFAHAQVFALADQIVEAVRSGAIRKFVVMAGCDGRFNSREYYTEFAKALPDDTVILTAGCAKYRYNKLKLGDIDGIPRVLDAGQCNDSYSIAVIALKLQEIFELDDINDLPVIYNIAWYEQKAVLVLLALLSLGIKNIHLGPTLPAFLSPNVTKVLVDNFGIAGITTVDEDMNLFFGN